MPEEITPAMHQLHEDEIITRLAGMASASIFVEPFPENQTQAEKKPVGPGQAFVYVGFAGTGYDNTQNVYSMRSSGPIQQDEYHKYEVTLLSNKLRGPKGIYALIDAVKGLLVGYTLTSCDKMYIQEVGFVNKDGNLYQFAIIFACKGMVVELVEEQVLPLLKGLTYSEDFPQDDLGLISSETSIELTDENDNTLEA
jgi:Gp37 protein